MIKDYFIMATRNIRKRRLRSWLTLVGIFVAIATIFVLISLSLGLESAVEEQFRLLGTDKLFILPKGQLAGPGTGGAIQLTQDDLDTINKVRGIKESTYWIGDSAKIEFADQTRYVMAIGLDLETSDLFMESGSYKIEEGRKLKEGEKGSIMIGSQYKHNNFFKKPVQAGDKLTVNGQDFKVKGIFTSIGSPPDDKLVFMEESDFRELFSLDIRIDEIVTQVEPGYDVQEIADLVEKKLRKSRDVTEKTQDFTIFTMNQLLESFGVILNILTGFLLGIAGISLIVGGIGIANTMFTSVLERTKEIGIMKSVGAKNSDITLIFLMESGLLGLIGGIIGVILGIAIGQSIEYIAINQLGTTLLAVETPLWLILGSLAFAFLSGAISGTWPAYRASKIKPTEALRYE